MEIEKVINEDRSKTEINDMGTPDHKYRVR